LVFAEKTNALLTLGAFSVWPILWKEY